MSDPMNDPPEVRIQRVSYDLAGVTRSVRAQKKRIAELEDIIRGWHAALDEYAASGDREPLMWQRIRSSRAIGRH